jgi:hypothetical protein
MKPRKQKAPLGRGANATSYTITGPEPSSPPMTRVAEPVGILCTSHAERVAALSSCYQRALRKGNRQKAAALFDAYLIVAGIVRLDGSPRAA